MEFKNKKIIIVCLTCVFVVLGVLILIFKKPFQTAINEWKIGRQIEINSEKLIDNLQAPFKTDLTGGKTPEETLELFIAAVQNNDLKKASDFYDVQHQEKAFARLERLQKDGLLDLWLKNIATMEKDKEQKGGRIIYYSYKYFDKETNKTLWAPVAFYLNPFTNVWKIVY